MYADPMSSSSFATGGIRETQSNADRREEYGEEEDDEYEAREDDDHHGRENSYYYEEEEPEGYRQEAYIEIEGGGEE